jgi:D-alanyl-D-alanine dipeptidase
MKLSLRLIVLLTSISLHSAIHSQTKSIYPFTVTENIKELNLMVSKNPMMELVELKSIVPNIKYDLRYAQKTNFTSHRLYPKRLKITYLRKEAAVALKSVALELEQLGLGILVWDAYRPFSVTEKFWDLIHDERYVANPMKGSGHNRGISIDMTIYDLKSGSPVDMPTGFDDFSEKAYHGYQNLTDNKIKNRDLLKSVMEKNGFIKFETEWWHYSLPTPSKYDILDIPFQRLNQK